MYKKTRRIPLQNKLNRFLCLICLYITGLTGLIAEMCWIKKGILIFGSTVHSLSVITAVFFLGLAIGNIVFGKKSTTITQPLLWYGLCELFAGFFIIISPQLFTFIENIYTILYPMANTIPSLLMVYKAILVSIVLLPPTIAMGASLPLMNKFFIHSIDSITPSISLLYAMNTLGGVAGVFLSGLVFIPKLGLTHTLMYAGSVNILTIVMILFYLYRYNSVHTQNFGSQNTINSDKNSQVVIGARHSASTMYFLFFFIGMAAMGNELVWIRYLRLIIHNTVYTYTMTLGIILIGIVLGSMMVRLFSSFFNKAAIDLFALVSLGCGFLSIVLLWISPKFWQNFIVYESVSILFWIAASVMFIPSLFMGICFPLGLRVVIRNYTHASACVGKMTAINLVGGIFGSLFTGLFMLPKAGLKITIVINTFIYLVIGCYALLFLVEHSKSILRRVIAGSVVIVWVISCYFAPVNIPQAFLSGKGELIASVESVSSIIAVIRNKFAIVSMEIDRLWQGSNQKTHQVMASHIPSMLHPNPKSIAVVGVGVGQTAKGFLLYPIEQLDCIDIEKAVFPLIKKHFNGSWLDDKRVRTIIDDGRDYLKNASQKYDIVSIEVGQLFRPQCALFYSFDFYQSIKKTLKPHALVSQFVPLTFLNRLLFLRIIKTFITAFPYSTLWYNSHELLLIGSLDGVVTFDPIRVSNLLKDKDIFNDCSFSIWGGEKYAYNRLENILAAFLCNSETLNSITKGYSILVDDRPELEYATASHQTYTSKELNEFMDFLLDRCDPVTSILKYTLGDSLLKHSKFTRKYNLLNVKAVSFLQQFQERESEQDLQSAYQINPYNLEIVMQTAIFAVDRNDFDGAYQLYNKILTFDSTYSPAYNNLGALIEQRGNYVEASRLYRLAALTDSSNAQAYLNITKIYLKRDMADSAQCYIKRALFLNPHDSELKELSLHFQ